ncbi:MAG: hypothetical protein RLY43_738 [Bacteroidota bacterium]|jgi:O-antigen/teichoic acid export membrane protein
MKIDNFIARVKYSFFFGMLKSGFSFLLSIYLSIILDSKIFGFYIFLTSIIISIRGFADFGMSNAFNSYITRHDALNEKVSYITTYLSIILVQITTVFSVIYIVYYVGYLDNFFFTGELSLIFLGVLAVYFQQHFFTVSCQVLDSQRENYKSQLSNFLSILVLFLFVWIFHKSLINDLKILFLIYIFVYSIATIINLNGYLKFSEFKFEPQIVRKFISFSLPLLFNSFMLLGFDFLDRWILQNYAGSSGQSTYQVALQMSSIPTILMMSLNPIILKEFSTAFYKKEYERLKILYNKFFLNTFFIVFLLCVIMFIFSDSIFSLIYGNKYPEGPFALRLLLFYTLFQCIGQINGSLLLITGHTLEYFKSGVGGLVMSALLLFLLVGDNIPINMGGKEIMLGLGLGAIGLSIKLPAVNLLVIGIQNRMISKIFNINSLFNPALIMLIFFLLLMCSLEYVFQLSYGFEAPYSKLFLQYFLLIAWGVFAYNRLRKLLL